MEGETGREEGRDEGEERRIEGWRERQGGGRKKML